jgi:hypothetical protein
LAISSASRSGPLDISSEISPLCRSVTKYPEIWIIELNSMELSWFRDKNVEDMIRRNRCLILPLSICGQEYIADGTPP